MPQFREMTKEENRERQLQLTNIRKMRRINSFEAERMMATYRKEWFLQPPGPRRTKAGEAEESIAEKSDPSRGSKL